MRLEHNLYAKSAGGYLGENVYDVSLKTAILMGELKWAENFIRDYKELLQPEFRESISNYALAYLNFAKKNYENTLSLLAKATIPKNITLKNGVKILGLMIYYERNMLEAAFDGIDSYRHFLLNDKIMAEWRKQLHRNFLIYYNKLLKIKSGKNIKNLAQIKNELKHNYNIVEREWLITKASELEKKN
jgi:hypothetical protein